LGFVILCIFTTSHESKIMFYGGYTLFALAVAIMLFAVLDTEWPVRRALTLRPLRAIGRVSYGVYLWHYFLFIVVAHYLDDWPLAPRVIVALAATALATVASWYLVERPFLRLKRRTRVPAETVETGIPPAGLRSEG
jgi:peptidoglycan/LPS O-acetylase OafA/YrhL